MLKKPSLLLLVLLFACTEEVENALEPASTDCYRDWKHIEKDGVLTLLAENSPASYFVYRGRNMGYEYELLYEFSKDIGVRLQVLMVNDLDGMLVKLDSCYGDILACNLTITEERKEFINFSEPHLKTHQVLVQRNIKDSLVTRLTDLRGKRIHVWKNSTFYDNLDQLNKEKGLGIHIIPTDGDILTEELIRQVADGEIDYTITDENVAKIDQRYHPNINIDFSMSDDEDIAFALRKSSPKLKEKLDGWLTDKKNRSTIGEVKRKYFERRNLTAKANDDYSSLTDGQLSPYDDIIKRESDSIDWDWRLIAAIIYQESKFETWKISWAGAFGLFQFMPATARQYGISENSSAEAQIHAGCVKLNKNFNQWLGEISDSSECILFTLATFNCGRGHIDDARSLCDVHGYNKDVWFDHVDQMMLNLSKPKYYRDPVVKNGYCRGRETYEYPMEVMQRYAEYYAAFPDEVPIHRPADKLLDKVVTNE